MQGITRFPSLNPNPCLDTATAQALFELRLCHRELDAFDTFVARRCPSKDQDFLSSLVRAPTHMLGPTFWRMSLFVRQKLGSRGPIWGPLEGASAPCVRCWGGGTSWNKGTRFSSRPLSIRAAKFLCSCFMCSVAPHPSSQRICFILGVSHQPITTVHVTENHVLTP